MPTYTLKSNAINAAASAVFVGDNGLVNLVSGGAAVTTVGTIGTATFEGRLVYGDGVSGVPSAQYLQTTVAAIAANQKFAVLLVGHTGYSANDNDSYISSPGPGYGVATGGPQLNAYIPSWGAANGPTITGYVHPNTKLYSFIYGRETGNNIKHYSEGTGAVALAANAYTGFAVASGVWKFGGTVTAAQNAGFGVAIFAVFIGVSPTELADFIAANGTGTTEADKAYSALLDSGGTAPSITTQPTNQSVAEGATATFTVAASGSPAPTYQWQRNPGGVGSWADISAATSASYTTPATTITGGSANNGDTYRCVATNASGSATSTAATLTVTAGNAPPTFPGPSISNLSISQGVAMSAVNVASKFSDTDALTFSAVGTWPAGVTVSSAGVISGTPTTLGNYTGLTVRATDTAAQTVDSNTFSIAVTAVTATLNFQAAGMEFGSRTGLGVNSFGLEVGVGYRYTVHADGLILGAAVYTSGVVTTDSAGKFPNLVDASVTAGVTYRVLPIRQSDGEAAAPFRVVAS